MVFSVLFYIRVIFKVIVKRLGLQYVFTFLPIDMMMDIREKHRFLHFLT